MTISASVAGNVEAYSRPGAQADLGNNPSTIFIDTSGDVGTAGTVNVTINQGGTVGRVITTNVESTSKLTFNLDISNPVQYQYALDYLGDNANALRGNFTVDGRTYRWEGFDELARNLTLLKMTNVAITIEGIISSGPSSTSAPKYLTFSTRNVIAFYEDGEIVVVGRIPDAEGRFLVGRIAGSVFTSSNPLGWRVLVADDSRRLTLSIIEGEETLATCHA